MYVPAMFIGFKASLAPAAQMLGAFGIRADRAAGPSEAKVRPTSRNAPAERDAFVVPPFQEIERAPLWLLKMEMTSTLAQCPAAARDEISAQIAICSDGAQLWAIRNGLFRALSLVTDEEQARTQVNQLLPFFLNWIPERQRVAL